LKAKEAKRVLEIMRKNGEIGGGENESFGKWKFGSSDGN
jgi:hypothetical protein